MSIMNNSSDNRNAPGNIKNQSSGSIAHATDVLLCLHNGVHTVTDISRQCQLGKSTVHRVLKLLQQHGLVVQNATDRHYYLGPLILQLASNPATTHEYLVLYAADEMKRLSALSEETTTLDILIGTQVFYLYEIPSVHDLRVTKENRISEPFHTGASSRILLAQLNDKQLKTALRNAGITQDENRTPINTESLTSLVQKARQEGYAVSCGERIAGALCISVPITNYLLPAVLSVVGPETRLQLKLDMVITELKLSAGRISRSIKEYGASPALTIR
jgi:DNA-binding IclR family transcriptional regulator